MAKRAKGARDVKRRVAMTAIGAAAAILFPALSGAAEPGGYGDDPYRYSDAGRGLDYILFPATFRRIGEDIRQGDFRLDLTGQASGLGTDIRVTGTVEVDCRTRTARLVAGRAVDARGAPADGLIGGVAVPTPWRALADRDEDAHLLRMLCGQATGSGRSDDAADPSRYLTFDDYPARALREGREGTTGFRAAFDASGVIVGCEIISSSGHADLDAETCRLVMRRARFAPAPPGTGLRYYENRVRWRIP